MNKLYSAIYFDYAKYPPLTAPHDWVNSTVNGIGLNTTSLFCRATPYRKIEDLRDYFFKNEIIWYRFFLSKDSHVIKILKVHVYELYDSLISDFSNIFPTYEYQFRSLVSDVNTTDDGYYKTYINFWSKYNMTYIDPMGYFAALTHPLNYKGVYDPKSIYNIDDVVYYTDNKYYVAQTHIGYWIPGIYDSFPAGTQPALWTAIAINAV